MNERKQALISGVNGYFDINDADECRSEAIRLERLSREYGQRAEMLRQRALSFESPQSRRRTSYQAWKGAQTSPIDTGEPK